MVGEVVQDMELLVALMKSRGWSHVRVESDELSLILSDDLNEPSLDGYLPSATPAELNEEAAHESAPSARGLEHASEVDPSWTAVTAPNLGTFYRSPKPGAEPFVEVGDAVSADTEVCLLEVMKLFTSVKAGRKGVVKQICANDAELVEGEQLLFYIGDD